MKVKGGVRGLPTLASIVLRGDAKFSRFISRTLAGRSLARVIEEELIAVGIIDDEEAVAPTTIFDLDASGLEFGAESV